MSAADDATVPVRAAPAAIVVYITALVGIEAVAQLAPLEVALASHAILLLALLNHAALIPSTSSTRSALLALALVPVLKISAVSLPQQIVPDVYWEAFPAAVTLVGVAVVLGTTEPFLDFRPRGRFGWPAQIAIATAGPAMALLAMRTFSWLDPGAASELTRRSTSTLLVAAFSGLTVELLFRGAIQPPLLRLFGASGVALATLLYASIFLSSGSTFAVGLALATGLVWGVVAAATRTPIGVTTSHALFAVTWVAVA